MKDYHHIDELVRQKFEGFEPVPPESVWEKVRTEISPDGPPPKGGNFTLPVITGLIVLIGLIGLMLLIGRMESTSLVQAGSGNPYSSDSQINHSFDADGQIADASTYTNSTPSLDDIGNSSQRILTNTNIPVRKPFEGQQAVNDQDAYQPQHPVTTKTRKFRNKANQDDFQRFEEKDTRLSPKTIDDRLDLLESSREVLTTRPITLEKATEEYRIPTKAKWSVGFHFSPEVSFYPSDNIENGLNYSIQVLPRIHFNKWHLAFGPGLRTGGDQGNYLINYNKYLGSYEDVFDVTFDSTENGVTPTYHTHTVDVYDTVPYYSISETKARYYYLDIPLLIGREWNFNKVTLFVNAGPSVSFLLGRSRPVADYPDENIRILNESPQIPARDQINWQIMAGAGFGYRLNDRVSLSLEPTFRYYLTNDYDKNGLNTRHPYSFGIRAGLIYHINN